MVARSAIVSIDIFYFGCHVALTNIDINMRTTTKPEAVAAYLHKSTFKIVEVMEIPF